MLAKRARTASRTLVCTTPPVGKAVCLRALAAIRCVLFSWRAHAAHPFACSAAKLRVFCLFRQRVLYRLVCLS